MEELAFLLVFLHLSLAYVKLNDCHLDQRSMINIWEERLDDKLSCNYDPWKPPRPLNGSDSVAVQLHFTMKSFNFVDEEFSIFTFAQLLWTDGRLTWNSSDYDGIESTTKPHYKLWVPGIRLSNSTNDFYAQSEESIMLCDVNSEGRVLCVSPIIFTTKCAVDLTDWPYDIQVCSIGFEPWNERETGVKINLDFGQYAVIFFGSEHGAEWDVMAIEPEENQDAEEQLKMTFTLARHAEVLGAVVIYPSVLLSLLTVSSLFLDVRYDTRLYLSCFSLFCHFAVLCEIVAYIPAHSSKAPRLLIYSRGSLIITVFTIVWAYILKSLCTMKTPVPYWVGFVNEYAEKSYVKFFRSQWEPLVKENDETAVVQAWTDFANILNSAWISVSVLVYVILCCAFVPLQRSIEQDISVFRWNVFE